MYKKNGENRTRESRRPFISEMEARGGAAYHCGQGNSPLRLAGRPLRTSLFGVRLDAIGGLVPEFPVSESNVCFEEAGAHVHQKARRCQVGLESQFSFN